MVQQTTRRMVFGTMTVGAVVAAGGAIVARAGGLQDGAATPGSKATPEEANVDAPTIDDLKDLWGRWGDLWNGDLAVASEIIAPEFVTHFAPAANSPSEVRGPDGLAAWIDQIMSVYTGYSVETTVGPIA